MSTPLLVFGHHCRFCGKLVSTSIADLYGSESAGYMCDRCLMEESQHLQRLGQQITQEATQELTLPGAASNCAMCGAFGDTFRLVHIDGGMGLVCMACEPKWILLNRPLLGPVAQYGLKLR